MPKTGSDVSWDFMTRHPAYLLALGFGSGLFPKAPGTAGTLIAFPFYYFIYQLSSSFFQLSIVAVLFIAGIWICEKTGKALGAVDDGRIVWDEIVAFILLLCVIPQTWWAFVVGFLLFRLFDIWKPFPIRYFERRVRGGFGVMFDDLLAAAYAFLVIQVLLQGLKLS